MKTMKQRVMNLKKDPHNEVITVNHFLEEADANYTRDEFLSFMKNNHEKKLVWVFVELTKEMIDDLSFWFFLWLRDDIFVLQYIIPEGISKEQLEAKIPTLRERDIVKK